MPRMALPSASSDLPPITLLLRRATEGDRSALDQVFESLYPDLRRVARARLHQQGRADAMNTTTLSRADVTVPISPIAMITATGRSVSEKQLSIR